MICVPKRLYVSSLLFEARASDPREEEVQNCSLQLTPRPPRDLWEREGFNTLVPTLEEIPKHALSHWRQAQGNTYVNTHGRATCPRYGCTKLDVLCRTWNWKEVWRQALPNYIQTFNFKVDLPFFFSLFLANRKVDFIFDSIDSQEPKKNLHLLLLMSTDSGCQRLWHNAAPEEKR